MRVTVRGCRGSVPATGQAFSRHGHATTCFEIDVDNDHRLLVDIGTGALTVPVDSCRWTVLLTHLHWDHVLGLPFFPPLFDPRHELHFHAETESTAALEEAIGRIIRPPWFPVSFAETPSKKVFHSVNGNLFSIGDLKVTARPLHHPGGVTAYRLERGGRSLVIATDVEHGDPDSDRAVRALAEGADVLIHDAQYLTSEHLHGKQGWGHSTPEAAAAVARDAGVGRLVLTSHDPLRTDEEIDEIVARTRTVFHNTIAAAEGLVIDI